MHDHPTNLGELSDQAAGAFSRRFGRRPRWVVAAPGRVNLIGEHVDYNDGFVLPMAIERFTVIAADTAKGLTATVFSESVGESVRIDMSRPIEPSDCGWAEYVCGVVQMFAPTAEVFQGAHSGQPALGGFDAVVVSDVPLGGGLSSSAALEVSVATLLEAMTGVRLDPVDKAALCQRAEHRFAGVPCGIMDQFASVLAMEDHLLLLDCRSQAYAHVPFDDESVTVLIANTNVRHELTEGAYAARRSQCESAARALGVKSLRDVSPAMLGSARGRLDDAVYRRAHHVVHEIARTRDAAAAIRRRQWDEVGRLMHDSHESLRVDYEVSCAELDLMVAAARSIGEAGGVIGSRMTGAGFGGCTVTLVRTGAVDDVSRQLTDAYHRTTGIEPTLFVTRPAGGARVIAGTG
jgi:galactokinase